MEEKTSYTEISLEDINRIILKYKFLLIPLLLTACDGKDALVTTLFVIGVPVGYFLIFFVGGALQSGDDDEYDKQTFF